MAEIYKRPLHRNISGCDRFLFERGDRFGKIEIAINL